MLSILPKLRPLQKSCIRRLLSCTSAALSKGTETPSRARIVVEPLLERQLIRVQGNEVVTFLQGLITNDVDHVRTGCENPNAMYALFLNKGGRVVYDTILYGTREKETYLLECDKSVASELRRHLMLYRVRRKINIDEVGSEFRAWAIFNADSAEASANIEVRPDFFGDMFVNSDPRTGQMGFRILTNPNTTWEDVAKVVDISPNAELMEATANCNYRRHRYMCGVGEGVFDLPPGKPFPLEINGDFLHGISFQKGCYIGQELTARVYHTGVIRKRLMPLRLTAAMESAGGAVKSQADATVGSIRGVSGDRALALLRVEQVLTAPNGLLKTDEQNCYVEKPTWWPTELPSRAALKEMNN